VNAASGVRAPKDLEGRRVGVRFWPNTAGVWARGALRDFYGVDLSKIHWVIMGVDRDGAPPPDWRSELIGWPEGERPESEDIDAMLLRGEIDAAIDANVLPSITRRDPRVARLVPNYVAEEKRYFRETGVFPTSHVVTLRRQYADAHPDAPLALLKAFRKARDIAIDNVEGADPKMIVVSWLSHYLDEQRALMGRNFYSYDVASNRVTLAALTDYAHQQGLTPRRVAIEELFHPSTLDAPDTSD
jgi:4,5-dihydroxyphthalate decarboxylase